MKYFSGEQDLNKKILSGAKKVFDIVSSTMGPGGRTVLLHSNGPNQKPIVTRDRVGQS